VGESLLEWEAKPGIPLRALLDGAETLVDLEEGRP
jgi:hypothetical protein